jgi:hypothetical protein
MLVAVLNCCSKEELEEEEAEAAAAAAADPTTPATVAAPAGPVSAETAERRKVIKNKIMAIGRMSRVFSLLREESERVSELKSVSGSTKLPYGTLALGAEGIKDAIQSFDDACVPRICYSAVWRLPAAQPPLGHRERAAPAGPRRRRRARRARAALAAVFAERARGHAAAPGRARSRARSRRARRVAGERVADDVRLACDARVADGRAARAPPAGEPGHDDDEPEHAPAQSREHDLAHQGGRRRRGRAGRGRVGEARE